MNTKELLKPTAMLDYENPQIVKLVEDNLWASMPMYDGIGAVYDFVRNGVKFGYNKSDNLAASEVLSDGYGQCNTKGVLLMALLRAIGVPCRLHGFTITKDLQRGVVPELIYPITPKNIVHSWVEIFFNDKWIELEGFILDDAYLDQLKQTFGDGDKGYCGYGAGTENLKNANVQWSGKNTYIQKTGINQDFGVFNSPDEFFSNYAQEFPAWKAFLYENVFRHWMNARAENIRSGKRPTALPN